MGLVSLVSRDEGMTWKSEELSLVRPERRKDLFATYIPPSFKRDPISGDWMAVIDGPEPYFLKWKGDHWKVVPAALVITDRNLIMMHPPIFIRNGTRIIAEGHNMTLNPIGGGTSIFHSDDGVVNWMPAHLPDTPHHCREPPHKELRWQNSGVNRLSSN